MRSAYRADDAAQCIARDGARWGEALALRVYTSRLLGADPALVLHGGGNTSVKAVAREVDGTSVDVLHVKGSGGDLATIGPEGFAACRLGPLRRLCALRALDDDAMVAALRSQMLDPSSPTPSVEALLHATLPGAFVDHTHADAVVALVDQPDAARIARDAWGDAFVYVPYVMPGFALARAVAQRAQELEGRHGLVLERHGIFTWGSTAEESYHRMILAVTAAEDMIAGQRARSATGAGAPAKPADTQAMRDCIAPVLRGAIVRAGQGRFLMEWRTEPAIMALLAQPAARELVSRGTVTPDHVIRTRPRPLWLEIAFAATGESLAATCAAAVDEYAKWYDAYFERHRGRSGRTLARLDTAPRIVLVPGCGALTLGRSIDDARIAGDIFAHAARVIADAETIGRFEPVSAGELFDVEYWSLEQAKLARRAPAGPLAGRIALVTGAASGIGRATAERLAALGAHVLLTDRAADALGAAVDALRTTAGSRVAAAAMDVTDAAAVRAAVTQCVRTFGGLDLLVSNAGTAPQGLLHTEAGEAAFTLSLDVNLMGHERVARAATGVMLVQDAGGCLLFNASKSAVNPGVEFGPYAVPKAGLLALMRQYAVDLGAHGIRSNAVNADRVRTDLFGDGVLETRARARGVSPDAYFRQNLLGRETTAHDVADAFAWLAQAEATSGCIISVDGGNAAAFLR